jgi:beta-lactam-binding protein with PASTA domain
MNNLILFLKSKTFRIHILLYCIVVVLIFWGALSALSHYTHHGETIVVPDFSNLKIEVLPQFISDKKLRYQIIDSVYDPKIVGGVVIKQDPEKNSRVKQNRIIYLTVSAKMPPLVKMPNLVDASLRQAQSLLQSYNLKLGKIEYRTDLCVNCVLAQMKNGKEIKPGTMIPKGSAIDLILGKGQNETQISILPEDTIEDPRERGEQ